MAAAFEGTTNPTSRVTGQQPSNATGDADKSAMAHVKLSAVCADVSGTSDSSGIWTRNNPTSCGGQLTTGNVKSLMETLLHKVVSVDKNGIVGDTGSQLKS